MTERREHIEGVRFNLSQKLYINDRFQVLTCRSLVASVGQKLLRVVRCLPSAAGLSAYTSTQRAGVLQASREETAG